MHFAKRLQQTQSLLHRRRTGGLESVAIGSRLCVLEIIQIHCGALSSSLRQSDMKEGCLSQKEDECQNGWCGIDIEFDS